MSSAATCAAFIFSLLCAFKTATMPSSCCVQVNKHEIIISLSAATASTDTRCGTMNRAWTTPSSCCTCACVRCVQRDDHHQSHTSTLHLHTELQAETRTEARRDENVGWISWLYKTKDESLRELANVCDPLCVARSAERRIDCGRTHTCTTLWWRQRRERGGSDTQTWRAAALRALDLFVSPLASFRNPRTQTEWNSKRTTRAETSLLSYSFEWLHFRLSDRKKNRFLLFI